MNAQRLGFGMIALAVVLGLLGWFQLKPGTFELPSVATVTAPGPVAPAEPPAVAPTPPTPAPVKRPPLSVGIQSRATQPAVTMPPCTAAVKRHETVERLAGVIVLVRGDLTPYATAYADAATASVPTNCGVPPLDAGRHRKALERLRTASALEPEVLAAVQTALGV